MRSSSIVILICMVLGLSVLCSLGTWQVNRMIWKEKLISQVEERIRQKPVGLEEIPQDTLTKETHEYRPVTMTGTFDHDSEVYFFTTSKNGLPGWNIHTPMIYGPDNAVIVNRGFVPFENRAPDSRLPGQTEGQQTVTGLLRFPLLEKPFGSLANIPDKREFYWRNVAEMSALMGASQGVAFLPVIIDAGEEPNPGGLPIGGTTIIAFPNNHLQYAITWYGLALTLLGVGGFFLYSRRKDEND
ncbi:MAG: SURF1 family protein [Pseudomonadota bacterium]